MSYSPPLGNAADFTKTGVAYTAPDGDAADFAFVPAVPTVFFTCNTSVDIKAVGNFDSAFSLSSASTPYFEHPYRSYSIHSSSIYASTTSLRDVQIVSSSTILCRPGARFYFSSTTDPSVKVVALLSALANVSSGSSASSSAVAFNLTETVIPSKTTARLKGGFNAMTRAVVQSRSLVGLAHGTTSSAVAAFNAHSIVRPTAQIGKPTVYSVSAGDSAEFAGSMILTTIYDLNNVSAVSAVCVPSRRGALSTNGSSLASFSSSYETLPVVGSPENAVYAKAVPNRLFVIT